MRGQADLSDITKSVRGSVTCEMLYTSSEAFAEKSVQLLQLQVAE